MSRTIEKARTVRTFYAVTATGSVYRINTRGPKPSLHKVFTLDGDGPEINADGAEVLIISGKRLQLGIRLATGECISPPGAWCSGYVVALLQNERDLKACLKEGGRVHLDPRWKAQTLETIKCLDRREPVVVHVMDNFTYDSPSVAKPTKPAREGWKLWARIGRFLPWS